jgi:hypothetical protein
MHPSKGDDKVTCLEILTFDKKKKKVVRSSHKKRKTSTNQVIIETIVDPKLDPNKN